MAQPLWTSDIILDDIKSDDKLGTIYKMGFEYLTSRKVNFSLHKLEFVDMLKLVSLNKDFPAIIIIIGAVPYDIEAISELLSAKLNKFPQVFAKTFKLIMDLLKI